MLWFRSLTFNLYYFGTMALWVLFMCLLLPFPRRVMRTAVRGWMRTLGWGMRWIVGLRWEIRGLDNLPEGPVVLASKHQSAWDTGIFTILVPEPIYVLKKELLDIPLWGWCAAKAGSVSVDREGGASALKQMLADCLTELDENSGQVIIFPEGTRTTPGSHPPYHPGVAAIYQRTDAPVIPVALNSGLYWGRRSFYIHSGTIVLEFLPAMPKGMDRRAFMADLERQIEDATARLVEEAGGVPE